MLWGVALVCALSGGHARAQEGETARHGFEVPAGRLEDALSTFARQAGITLSFDPVLVRDMSAAALTGRSTVPEGLAALLAPHRLQAVRGDSGAYSVRPVAPIAAPAPRMGELRTVTVTVDPERAEGPVQGYVAQRSATANRTDTALIETPRAVSVVSREQMDDQAVQTVEQSLRYSAGVLTEVDGYDLRRPSMSVRGFAPVEFLDGLRLFTLSPYADWPVEPQGLERVELLKGPGVLFYGGAPPSGGVISMVSKRPRVDTVREVGLSTGSHDRYQAHADLGGAVEVDGSLTWRLNGLLRRSGSQTDFGRDDRVFVAPALSWTPTSRTTITLIASATRDRVTPKSVWPSYALVTPNLNGSIPVSRLVGEPGVEHYNRNADSLTFLLEHRLDDHWTLRQNVRSAAFDLDALEIYGSSAWRGDLRTIDRAVSRRSRRIRIAMLDQQIEGGFQTGTFAHTLLVGMDNERDSGQEAFGLGAAPPIDAFAPAYGARVDVPGLMPLSLGGGMKLSGVYIQDQIRTGPWVLGLAARHDGDRNGTSSLNKTSYNVGLLHLVGEGLAAYANYSTSFRPVPSIDASGPALQPELGRQFELGLKYSPLWLDAMFTLSAFDLRKSNVLNTDTLGFSTETAVRARGLEFEARAALTRRLKLLASYTLLDAKMSRSSAPEQWGKQPLDTARRSAALWLDFRFGSSGLQGWSAGLGVRYVDKTPASIDNSLFNPAYTVVDAALRYERGPYSFALNATNLFDRICTAGQGQVFGQARALQAKVAYRW